MNKVSITTHDIWWTPDTGEIELTRWPEPKGRPQQKNWGAGNREVREASPVELKELLADVLNVIVKSGVSMADATSVFMQISEFTENPKANFYDWLTAKRGEATAIGDLANDVKHDEGFPSHVNDLKQLTAHLDEQGACVEAVTALIDAHNQWAH
jgi:uncharacterized protein YozE (UPF0346 family)